MSGEQPTCGWCGERHPLDFWCGQRLIGLQEQVDALEIHSAFPASANTDASRQSLSGRLGQVVKWTHGMDDKVDGVLADKVKLDERISALEVVTQELRGKVPATMIPVGRQEFEVEAGKLKRRLDELEGLSKLHDGQVAGLVQTDEALYGALNKRLAAVENNRSPALAGAALTSMAKRLSRRLDALEKQQSLENLTDFIDVVFDRAPGCASGRFVEVEDSKGRSISVGGWIRREDGFWALRIPDPRRGTTEP